MINTNVAIGIFVALCIVGYILFKRAPKDVPKKITKDHNKGIMPIPTPTEEGREWSSSKFVMPTEILCKYVQNQGRYNIENSDVKNRDELLNKWDKLDDDAKGFWHYHATLHGGNSLNFICGLVAPNMKKRKEILTGVDNSHLIDLIDIIIITIESNYIQQNSPTGN